MSKMIQSLLLRSWHSRLKSASLCHCRHLSLNYTWRSTLNHCSYSSSLQHLSPKLSDRVRLNIGSVRLFLTHKHVPTEKVARLANKDRIPDTYELIYSIPARMGLQLGYSTILVLCGCMPYFVYKVWLEERDEIPEMKLGAFDNEEMLSLQLDQMPYVLGGLVVVLVAFWVLITRIPYRIYRSSERDRHYIAVFLNRLWPWGTHNHQFPGGSKLKFNFFTRYFFYVETYQLGSRRAILFPTSFRSAFDHDEMIDFQLGKSYFNVREFNKEFDEKEKIPALQKKL